MPYLEGAAELKRKWCFTTIPRVEKQNSDDDVYVCRCALGKKGIKKVIVNFEARRPVTRRWSGAENCLKGYFKMTGHGQRSRVSLVANEYAQTPETYLTASHWQKKKILRWRWSNSPRGILWFRWCHTLLTQYLGKRRTWQPKWCRYEGDVLSWCMKGGVGIKR